MNSSLFPFTAIIGMDLARYSLIYHAIDRTLGGTVLMGHRGCAKKYPGQGISGNPEPG